MTHTFTVRHYYVPETLARDLAALHGRDMLQGVGDRTLAVEEVARQAGLKPAALSPAGMGQLRIVALAEIAKVLGVESCRLFPE